MVSAVAAARSDDVDLTFRRLTYWSFYFMHKDLPERFAGRRMTLVGSTHLYIGADGALEQWTYMGKFRERSELLPEVFFNFTCGITGELNLVSTPKKQNVRSYMDD